MPKFRVWFNYSGRKSVIIKAKDEENAKDLYYDGQWNDEDEEDHSQDYELDKIEEV